MRKVLVTLIVAVCASNSFAYYQAEQGRWVNRDPIEELGFQKIANNTTIIPTLPLLDSKQNLMYVFVSNNTINRIDWLGLDDCVCNTGSNTGRKPKAGWDPYNNAATDNKCSTQVLEAIPGLSGWLFQYATQYFKGPCQEHDACYATCNTTQGECDADFANAMGGLCDSLSGFRKTACTAMAINYFQGVSWFGDSPMAGSQSFSALQDAACEDCCCSSN